MSDKDSKSPPGSRPPGERKQSGRVAYDSKGNPVWEWEASTGVFARDVSTQRLKKLEATLSLEATQPVPKQKNLSVQEPGRLPGGGINPYDSGGLKSSTAPAVKHPVLAHKQQDHVTAPRRSLVSKYGSQTKEKKPQGIWQRLKAKLDGGRQ